MKRPGKPEGQYYLSHQTVDCDHGVILGITREIEITTKRKEVDHT